MCGRYSEKYPAPKLITRFKASNRDFKFDPPKEIAPTMLAPVVVETRGKRILRLMKWGFIPSWAKDLKKVAKPFNAKSETVDEKPFFRSAFKTQRCLVPADSFFEWRTETPEPWVPKRKQPIFPEEEEFKALLYKPRKVKYRFGVRGEQLFSLAGLWSTWTDAEGKELDTFTILTCEPNPLMEQYHNRMPVILDPRTEGLWLDLTAPPHRVKEFIFKPYPAGAMGVDTSTND